MESFFARVVSVFPTNTPFYERVKGNTPVYNDNKDFVADDIHTYGAITYAYENEIIQEDIAYPFDKNNFTFPIKGETVIILKIDGETYYLPYSSTPYPNYREKARLKVAAEPINNSINSNGGKDLRETKETGGSNNPNAKKDKENTGGYVVNEKIKFLNPKNGDTIISGRAGIYIRNKQNPELDSKPIGTLINEDINKDGTSIYIVSGKVKIPFKETTKKQKVAFKDFPSSDKLKGDQLFVNSDRIVLSAKASEFIIFGKGNTGIITDGRFTVDSIGDTHIQSNSNIVLQTNRNIVLGTDGTGNIWLGGVKPTKSQAGEEYQKMVMGGELIKILGDILDEIAKIQIPTGVGPSGVPVNAAAFKSIKGKLKVILSARNYLSK